MYTFYKKKEQIFSLAFRHNHSGETQFTLDVSHENNERQ